MKHALRLVVISLLPLLMAANCSGSATPPQEPVGDSTPPAVPQGLVATVEINGIGLRWQANTESDLKHYRLYRSDATTVLSELAEVAAGTERYLVTGLTPEAEYSFAISAEDGAGNVSDMSAEITVWFSLVDEAPAESPQVVSSTPSDGATGVALNSRLELRFSEVMNRSTTEPALRSTPPLDCRYSWDETFTELVCEPEGGFIAATGYTITLGEAATDIAGNALTPISLSFTTGETSDPTPPAAPQGLAAEAIDRSVLLSWAANGEGDLARYRIYGGASELEALGDALETDMTYTVTGLENGTTYRFAITAIDTAGNVSPLSNEVTATPGPQTGSLALAVTGLPEGTNASILVMGDGGYSRTITTSETLADLPAGEYTLQAEAVLATDGFGYSPNSAEQTVSVAVGATAEVNVIYTASSGSLFVGITGLSLAAEADIHVTGPGGYSEHVTKSVVLTDLAPGAYELRSQDANTDDAFFHATGETSQSVQVAGGSSAEVSVSYSCVRVVIPDFRLANLVREELDKPSGDLTCADMALLEEFDEYFPLIYDLSGIQHAVNLKALEFEGEVTEVVDNKVIYSGVDDLSPLENLTELESLEINESPVTSIESLARLTALKTLYLEDISFSDFSPLAGLTSLESFSMRGNYDLRNDTDLSAIAGLTSLKSLGIYYGERSDISFVENLTALETLNVINTGLNDLSPVANLINLKSFGIHNNAVTDLSPVQNLSKLESLIIIQNPITDLSPLSNKGELKLLYAYGLTLDNLNALGGLPKLETLLLNGAQVGDISALNNVATLKNLNLSGTGVSDYAALANLGNLEQLNVSSNNLTSVSSLAGLTAEVYIDLSNNALSDVASLASNTSIVGLDLRSNNMSELSGLGGMTGLSYLDLSYNELTDISSLSNLGESITNVSLRNNYISDISALVANPNIDDNDFVRLRWNCLDLTEGSDDDTAIDTLEGRGVRVRAYSNTQRPASECN